MPSPIARYTRLICLLGLSIVFAGPGPGALAEEAQLRDRQVPYLTLRNRTGSDDPRDIYGDERSDLKAGWCKVRDLDLGALTPLSEAMPVYVREEFLRTQSIREDRVAAVLNSVEATAGDGRVQLYVHGYYISFEKGCRRAVLLQENAGLAGRFLWFSWPSDGALTNYTHDEADLYWSVPDMADAILEMERRLGDDRINVIGHSLGARGVVLALYEVATRRPDIRLGNVVLLAPDMDFQIFQRILPRIAPIAETITIYATNGDRPLALSAQLHGYPRLGEAENDFSQLDPVEVIDLSDLPVESPTGHLYHIHSNAVGDDLNQLLNEGKRAADRRKLVRTGNNTWKMQP